MAVSELNPADPVVYALPRGGVPVGYEVARSLGCPLDVIIVRKVGFPLQPELAMGAVAEGGITVRNEEVLAMRPFDEVQFEEVSARERVELDRRVGVYRDVAEQIPPQGRVALVVDDGLATGTTALAAVSVLAEMGADEVWLAVPVAPRSAHSQLAERTDRFVTLLQPRHFGAVGRWYEDFSQTTDDEVRTILADSRLA